MILIVQFDFIRQLVNFTIKIYHLLFSLDKGDREVRQQSSHIELCKFSSCSKEYNLIILQYVLCATTIRKHWSNICLK